MRLKILISYYMQGPMTTIAYSLHQSFRSKVLMFDSTIVKSIKPFIILSPFMLENLYFDFNMWHITRHIKPITQIIYRNLQPLSRYIEIKDGENSIISLLEKLEL